MNGAKNCRRSSRPWPGEHGVRILGPNTMGVLNPFAGFSTAFVDIPREASPAPLTMVAQSGVFQVGASSFTGRMGKAIDVGNAGDVDVVDVLEYLENDPQTRIIVLHLEGIKRGRQFLEVAARIVPQKPIIALKTGHSAAGARAAMSHTGSLVGEDSVFELAFREAGVIRVRSLVELRAICRAFLHFRPMAGPRLGMVTATGAFGIMAADACSDYGLELASLPEKLRDLEEDRIDWHQLHNPVDIWPLGMVTGSFTGVFRRAAAGLLASDQVDGVLGVGPALASPLHADLDMAATVRKLLRDNAAHKPLALLLYGDEAAYRAQTRALAAVPDVACYDTLEEAVLGLAATWRYHQIRQQLPAGDLALPAAPAVRPVALPAAGAVLGEAALALLRHYQIPVAPSLLTLDAAAAAAFAKGAGYPVVLKIISPEWLHKSDLGGVRLNLADGNQLQATFEELVELFRTRTPQGTLQGILVQRQVPRDRIAPGAQTRPPVRSGAGGRRRGHLYGSPEGYRPGLRAADPGAGPVYADLAENLPHPGRRPGPGGSPPGIPAGPDAGPFTPGLRLPGNPGIGPQPGSCRPPGLPVRRLAAGSMSMSLKFWGRIGTRMADWPSGLRRYPNPEKSLPLGGARNRGYKGPQETLPKDILLGLAFLGHESRGFGVRVATGLQRRCHRAETPALSGAGTFQSRP